MRKRDLAAINKTLDELTQDRLLYAKEHLRQRIEALDWLECHVLDSVEANDATPALDASSRSRAETLRAALESINEELYQCIRTEIRQSASAEGLLKAVASLHDDTTVARAEYAGYDDLDVLVSGVLRLDDPGDSVGDLAPEMVFYQPTPARDIFDLIRRLDLTEHDVLMDLGAGLGHMSLLAAICTPAQCVGIELEEVYVAAARNCALALKVGNATFLKADVRDADLSRGTVFYLYTPFNGSILDGVLGTLEREASQRFLRICTLGPCTARVAEEPWLETSDTLRADRVVVFHRKTPRQNDAVAFDATDAV